MLVISLVTVPFTTLLVGHSTAVADDVAALHLPLISRTWTRILHGDAPWWAHWMFSGYNIVGAGQAAIFYPLNAVLGVLSPVAAFRWWTLMHLWIAASGAFVWAWHSWRSRPGAVVAGIAYGLNGFAILHLVHMPFSMATAWFPWLLLGLDLVRERWTLGRAGAVVGSIAMIAFSGHPQMLWLALVASGIYTAAQLARRGSGWWPTARVAASVLLGLGVAAVQLVPQYLFSRTSVRPTITQREAFEMTAAPRHLLAAVVGDIMGGSVGVLGLASPWRDATNHHEVANFAGAVVVLLAAIGAVMHRRDRRIVGLVLVAVVAVFAALGDTTPVGGVLFHVLPLADRFRVWARWMILFNLAVFGLAAAGVQALLSAPRRKAALVAGAAAVCGGLVALTPALTDLNGARVRGHDLVIALAVPVVALALMAAAAALTARTTHRVAEVLLVAAVAVEMVVFAAGAPWHVDALSPDAAATHFRTGTPWFGTPFDAPGGVDRYATDTLYFRGDPIVHDLQFVNGYDPLMPADYGEMTGLAWGGWATNDTLWRPGWVPDVLRVTTLLALPDTTPTGTGWTRVGPLPGGGAVRYTRVPRLAEAAVIGAVDTAPLPTIATRLGDDRFDGTGVVLLDDTTAARTGFAGRTVAGQAGEASGALGDLGSGTFTVNASRPAVLMVSTAWLPGWSARVNGRDAPVARADGLVLAVPVPEGESTVELVFHPPGLANGAAISLVSLAVLAGVSGVAVRRRRLRLLPVQQ